MIPPLSLPPLPTQPEETPWPTTDSTAAEQRAGDASSTDWPRGEVPRDVDLAPLLDLAFDEHGPLARTQAVLIVHRGRIVVERYEGALEFFGRLPEPITQQTAMTSWSMAKSMLHSIVGMLVAEGRLNPGSPARVPQWQEVGDPRGSITLDHLLSMRDGLAWNEDYVDAGGSDVIEMLFGKGREDMAHFAADRPLAAEPGARFNYSSGTSVIISGIVARLLGPGEPSRRFVMDRLFEPIGMTSAVLEMDSVGTWVASSFVRATARDFARFGLLNLRGGTWDGRQLLPSEWVDTARCARSADPTGGEFHSMHWWVPGDPHGTFTCLGFEGQSISLCPTADLIVVRLGKTSADHSPDLRQWRAAVIEAFASRSVDQPPS